MFIFSTNKGLSWRESLWITYLILIYTSLRSSDSYFSIIFNLVNSSRECMWAVVVFPKNQDTTFWGSTTLPLQYFPCAFSNALTWLLSVKILPSCATHSSSLFGRRRLFSNPCLSQILLAPLGLITIPSFFNSFDTLARPWVRFCREYSSTLSLLSQKLPGWLSLACFEPSPEALTVNTIRDYLTFLSAACNAAFIFCGREDPFRKGGDESPQVR